jgi:LPXTG-motif cell wall-anchored protein
MMLAMSGPVGAATGDTPPSGDDRATSFSTPGGLNVTAADCATLWPGTTAITVTATVDATYIKITGLPAGTTVSGVIVKGGPAYNRYDLAKLGTLPWAELHSPLSPGNETKPAGISHWFACGKAAVIDQPSTPVTTNPTTTLTTTSTKTASTTTTATSVPTSTVPTSTVPTSITTAAVVPSTTSVAVADASNLPDTGANVGWLVVIGAVLLLGGGIVLGVPKVRNALLRRS